MPIYEYQCEHCEHEMEAIQRISDAPLKDCPECKQATLRKLVSATAFKLTGTGWYETDFKEGKEDKKASEDNDNSNTTKETKGKESGDSGEKSASKTEQPKKKISATESSE